DRPSKSHMPRLQQRQDERQSRCGVRTPVRDRSERNRRRGTNVESVVPDAPCLQGGSRHFEFLGGLTLGDALSSQLTILLEEVRTFESIPMWLAGIVAFVCSLDYGSHNDLLCQSFAF